MIQAQTIVTLSKLVTPQAAHQCLKFIYSGSFDVDYPNLKVCISLTFDTWLCFFISNLHTNQNINLENDSKLNQFSSHECTIFVCSYKINKSCIFCGFFISKSLVLNIYRKKKLSAFLLKEKASEEWLQREHHHHKKKLTVNTFILLFNHVVSFWTHPKHTLTIKDTHIKANLVVVLVVVVVEAHND